MLTAHLLPFQSCRHAKIGKFEETHTPGEGGKGEGKEIEEKERQEEGEEAQKKTYKHLKIGILWAISKGKAIFRAAFGRA